MGNFIWNERTLSRNTVVVFKKVVDLKEVPEMVNFNIFANSNYSLYVNGHFASLGPARFDEKTAEYDEIDVAKYLKVGTNIIGVLVRHINYENFVCTVNKPAFYLECSEISEFNSDYSWKSKLVRESENYAPCLSFALPAAEYMNQAEFDEQQLFNDDFNGFKDVIDGYEYKLQKRTAKNLRYDKIGNFNIDVNKITSDYIECKGSILLEEGQEIREAKAFATIIAKENKTVKILSNHHLITVNGTAYEPVENDYIGYRKVFSVDLVEGENKIEIEFQIKPPLGFIRVAIDKKYDCEFKSDEMVFEKEVTGFSIGFPGAYYLLDDYDKNTVKCGKVNEIEFKKADYPNGVNLLVTLDKTTMTRTIFNLKNASGADIDIVYGEHLGEDRLLVKTWMPLAERSLVSEDDFTYMPIMYRGYHYMGISIRNFSKDIKFTIDIKEITYDMPKVGDFSCSDKLLSDIFAMCKRTSVTNMIDAYVDTTVRESGMYVRDSDIQYQLNTVITGDDALMKRTIELYAASALEDGRIRCVYPCIREYIIADFVFNYVDCVYDYFMRTRDTETIKKLHPVIIKAFTFFHDISDQREDKLLDGDWDINMNIYSQYGGFHGDNTPDEQAFTRHGINACFTLMYLRALKETVYMSDVLDIETEDIQKRIAIIEKSVNEKFYNEEKGAYADNLEHKIFSAQTNSWAVLADIIPQDRVEGVKNFLSQYTSPFRNKVDSKDGELISCHFSYYFLDALYKIGLQDVATEYIKNGWEWMIKEGFVTTPEFLRHNESHCHGWSSSPAFYMVRNILGVSFEDESDISTFKLKVNAPEDVTWAKGIYPHPQGEIHISWQKQGDEIVSDVNIIKK